MKKTVFVFVLLISICGCSPTTTSEIKQVTCNGKDEIIKNEEHAMLIDVRTKEEYDSKHLENAVNIPYDTIVDELSTYGTIDFDVPIIVYCKSGGRSNMAATSLVDAGYKNVYDLGAISNCDGE